MSKALATWDEWTEWQLKAMAKPLLMTQWRDRHERALSSGSTALSRNMLCRWKKKGSGEIARLAWMPVELNWKHETKRHAWCPQSQQIGEQTASAVSPRRDLEVSVRPRNLRPCLWPSLRDEVTLTKYTMMRRDVKMTGIVARTQSSWTLRPKDPEEVVESESGNHLLGLL